MRGEQIKNTCVASWLMAGFALFLGINGKAMAGPIGDRLVVAVNNIPYTQRQVEAYITVKESLRPENDEKAPVIDGRSWSEALSVFTEEMMILQEAQRLGSFTAPDQLLDKYNAVIRRQLARSTGLKKTMARLGVDEPTISRTLDAVLRVASFRHNKDRQEGQSPAPKSAVKAGGQAKWLNDLIGRANTRVFEGAATYVVIEPALGRRGESL